MLKKTISYQTTLSICMVLGIKLTYIEKINTSYGYRYLKSKRGIHHIIVLNV